MKGNIHGYSSPFSIGHKALARDEERPGLFEVEVFVEEKIDGSQFSFMRSGEEVFFRSRGAQVFPETAGMFKAGCEALLELFSLLRDGWTYRGEYLAKPKHNSLAYDRVPTRNTIIFDIEPSPNNFLAPEERLAETTRLGLESVPEFFRGRIESAEQLKEFFTRDSVLGGQKIEGVVIKPLAQNLWGQDKKLLMGKFVSEDFKEVHSKKWKKTNLTQGDVVARLVDEYRTPARWTKAVLHLRERGELEESPRDIGRLLKEASLDVLTECEDEIKEKLFKHFWKHISRGVIRGLPEWYKAKLANDALDLIPDGFTPHESVLAGDDDIGAKPERGPK